MEGDKVYDESYKTVKKLIKENTTSSITINYNKLDELTASTIRLALADALNKRKSELWNEMQGVHHKS